MIKESWRLQKSSSQIWSTFQFLEDEPIVKKKKKSLTDHISFADSLIFAFYHQEGFLLAKQK